MPGNVTLCRGVTKKGSNCKLSSQKGSEFCRYHQPEKLIEKEQTAIKKFLSSHKEGVLGLFAGAIVDPIAADIYDYIKDKLQVEHLVPPIVKSKEKQEETNFEIPFRLYYKFHYILHNDFKSLSKLVPLLKTGMENAMDVKHVKDLLGKPKVEVSEQGLGFSWTTLLYTSKEIDKDLEIVFFRNLHIMWYCFGRILNKESIMRLQEIQKQKRYAKNFIDYHLCLSVILFFSIFRFYRI